MWATQLSHYHLVKLWDSCLMDGGVVKGGDQVIQTIPFRFALLGVPFGLSCFSDLLHMAHKLSCPLCRLSGASLHAKTQCINCAQAISVQEALSIEASRSRASLLLLSPAQPSRSTLKWTSLSWALQMRGSAVGADGV